MSLADGKKDVLTFVVTPLNVLGKQNERMLAGAGIMAVALTGDNANEQTFKSIENGKYSVVVINPELLMGHKNVKQWWSKADMTKKILHFIFDEGHCISQWGSFQKDYKRVGELRWLIPRPERIPFYIASATLPPPVLHDVKNILRFRADDTKELLRSNDRPDIHLLVRPLEHPAGSFEDLAFLFPEEVCTGAKPPKKFLVFFDNTKEAEAACGWIQKQLPSSMKKSVKWFHSVTTQEYREDNVKALQESSVVGFCCTDAFGMVRCLCLAWKQHMFI
ncbi:hypothetical protein C0991_001314 [Blastosporella zonata]|nr:hypothetical protein C0991_008517 [Blastosporella zonata]KAG6852288.1 hypothetical protein C0991_001314 [Blastosporella zonata]